MSNRNVGVVGLWDCAWDVGNMLAHVCSTIQEPWLGLDPLRVGVVPHSLRTPDAYVTVMDGDEPILRIDVYGDPSVETFAFSAAIVWRKWVAVGFGSHVHLVGLHDRVTSTLELQDYFAHLYEGPEYLLAASATRLFRIEPDGSLLWMSNELGIDGVVVDDADAEVVNGEGDWDPPGGWRSFSIGARDGMPIEVANP